MTADATLLTREARRRLLERLAEADELNRLMREPGGLPSVPEPLPLHRTVRDTSVTQGTAMTTPAPGDPHGLGPWTECASCNRRYRPAHQSGQCYDCLHQLTEP